MKDISWIGKKMSCQLGSVNACALVMLITTASSLSKTVFYLISAYDNDVTVAAYIHCIYRHIVIVISNTFCYRLLKLHSISTFVIKNYLYCYLLFTSALLFLYAYRLFMLFSLTATNNPTGKCTSNALEFGRSQVSHNTIMRNINTELDGIFAKNLA